MKKLLKMGKKKGASKKQPVEAPLAAAAAAGSPVASQTSTDENATTASQEKKRSTSQGSPVAAVKLQLATSPKSAAPPPENLIDLSTPKPVVPPAPSSPLIDVFANMSPSLSQAATTPSVEKLEAEPGHVDDPSSSAASQTIQTINDEAVAKETAILTKSPLKSPTRTVPEVQLDIEAQIPAEDTSTTWTAEFDNKEDDPTSAPVIKKQAKENAFTDVSFSPDAPSLGKSVKTNSIGVGPDGSPHPTVLEYQAQGENASLLSSGQTKKAQKAKRKVKVTPLLDEEQGLNIVEVDDDDFDGDDDIQETKVGEPNGRSMDGLNTGEKSCMRRTFCWRRPFLSCFLLFVLSLLIARGVGKSSNSSLSQNEDSPIKQQADENVRRLAMELKSRPQPIIISTAGSNAEGMKAVRKVLSKLGMEIPELQFHGLVLGDRDGTQVRANFHRVLKSSLTPEKKLLFDERSVGDASSLLEWQLGRAFIASCVNATVHAIPDSAKSSRWAFAHPRAGYLLPYFASIFGAENFLFVHIVSNGMNLALSGYEEFRSMCELLMFESQCKPASLHNKLQYWAQINEGAFRWAKAKLDVDRYVAIRAEDFLQGRVTCIERVAKALGLKTTPESLEAASAAGKTAQEPIQAVMEELTKQEMSDAVALPIVERQLDFWGYDPNDMSNEKDCLSMSWV